MVKYSTKKKVFMVFRISTMRHLGMATRWYLHSYVRVLTLPKYRFKTG